ncbi:MAG: hypothetical protein IT324_19910 [Anaerolineae bacterium]|nr:hypothetical protein [Anaerolineae bacterium]
MKTTTVQVSGSERLTSLSGIVFAVLTIGSIVFFISNLAAHLPPVNAAPKEHVAFYTTYGQTLTLNNYMWILPIPFFLFFLGGVYSVLRRAEGDSMALSTAALTAGIAAVVPWITNIAVENLGTTIAVAGGDPVIPWAFGGLTPTGSMGLSGLARAAFLLATALVLLRGGVAPRWIGWFGIVLAVLNVVGSLIFIGLDLFPFAFLGNPLMAIWAAALSIAWLRKPHAAERLVLEHNPA